MSNGKPSKQDRDKRHPHGGPPGQQPDPDPEEPDPIEPEEPRIPDPDPDPNNELEYGQSSTTRSFTTKG